MSVIVPVVKTVFRLLRHEKVTIPTTFRNLVKDSRIMTERPPPVVVVLGSTASGKSQLAIDLAKRVDGEVISADSMQVYDGLDILTNKATTDEMEGIPHHMIGVVSRKEPFNVVKFRNMALPILEEILLKGKVPFIVGGTNYYIESLLWKVLMDETEEPHQSHEMPFKRQKMCAETSPVLDYMEMKNGDFSESDVTEKWTEEELHNALKQVDPDRALKIHPRDRRKVLRSLQVYFRTGKRHSALIEEQCSITGSGNSETEDVEGSPSIRLGGPLRYSNVVCLWIQAERSILNERINKRVDKMVERGIQKEIDDYVDCLRASGDSWDFEKGQMQSIGVKEFQEYILLTPECRTTEKGQELFKAGLEQLKVVTRQYAKRQVQWMTQRFLKESRRQLPPVYGLNGNETDIETWTKNVTEPATEILETYLKGEVDDGSHQVLKDKRVKVLIGEVDNDLISRRCDPCGKVLLGSVQWNEHVRSARHWKVVKSRKKELERLTNTLSNCIKDKTLEAANE